MSADIIHLQDRLRRPIKLAASIEVHEAPGWTCVLLRDDVSVGQLVHALRHSDLALSNDPLSGVATIHRRPCPDGAA